MERKPLLVFVIDDDEDNMLGLFHWMFGEASCTPIGRMTLHVSVYEVPVTPDPSPDTTTSGDSATTAIDISYQMQHSKKCLTYLKKYVSQYCWVNAHMVELVL